MVLWVGVLLLGMLSWKECVFCFVLMLGLDVILSIVLGGILLIADLE